VHGPLSYPATQTSVFAMPNQFKDHTQDTRVMQKQHT